MPIRTDSIIVEHNEDGSTTTTEIYTTTPATTLQKAGAWGVLGVLFVAPFTPLIAAVVHEKWETRREARKEAKANKNES